MQYKLFIFSYLNKGIVTGKCMERVRSPPFPEDLEVIHRLSTGFSPEFRGFSPVYRPVIHIILWYFF